MKSKDIEPTPPSPQEELSQLFGSYKAEWLRERMYDLFTEPSYFPDFTTSRPCLLIGGRGTGKTTVLRCMSYEGQFALRGQKREGILEWPFYGFYHRVNTNRVTAFRGPELSEERWVRTFAHYFNLVMCDVVFEFLEWFQLHCPDAPKLTGPNCARVAASLHLSSADSIQELARLLSKARVQFEAYINNVADGHPLQLSMQGAPVDVLFEGVLSLPQFQGKSFFFLLDEYENLEDYQQRVVNTLIKHSGDTYTFKVAVKELGWRCRTTLNENEQLISPADYVRIHIGEQLQGERFRDFAIRVCNDRIARVQTPKGVIANIQNLLPGIEEEEEAKILDGEGEHLCAGAAKELEELALPAERAVLEEMTDLQKYFLVFWSRSQSTSLREVWEDFLEDRPGWQTRYQNYRHALLYTLRRGKRGIQKYYAGCDVFAQIAGANIRYFLELVEQSLLAHLAGGGSLNEPVNERTQTIVAQNVGKKNLAELEGLSVHGAKLTKLLLGLGRILQIMAAEAEGHAPEVNQFHLRASAQSGRNADYENSGRTKVDDLLTAAVMHLALLRFPGNKLEQESDTREYDYMVHPVFSPFFVFSYRHKRKMTISAESLLGLVENPRQTIRQVLAAQNRSVSGPLPEQLLLFEAYYNADS